MIKKIIQKILAWALTEPNVYGEGFGSSEKDKMTDLSKKYTIETKEDDLENFSPAKDALTQAQLNEMTVKPQEAVDNVKTKSLLRIMVKHRVEIEDEKAYQRSVLNPLSDSIVNIVQPDTTDTYLSTISGGLWLAEIDMDKLVEGKNDPDRYMDKQFEIEKKLNFVVSMYQDIELETDIRIIFVKHIEDKKQD